MKKRIFAILLCAVILTFITACSSSSSKNNEYTIDEFGKMYQEADKDFKDKTKYMTDDEIFGEKGYKIYTKCAKNVGLPIGKEIVINGKKKQSIGFIEVVSDDEKKKVSCFFDNYKGESIFIKDGENIKISGVFSADKDSYSVISKAKIVKPDIEVSYKNDINEKMQLLTEKPNNSIVYGEVTEIMTGEEFLNMTKQLNAFKVYNENMIGDKVAVLSSDDGSGKSFYFSYHNFSEKQLGELNINDKIAVYGDAYSMMGLLKADGSYDPMIGMIDCTYDYYIFK